MDPEWSGKHCCKQVLNVWVFGRLWCRGWLVVDVWISTASILNLCAISIDRYVAVTRPVKYRSIMTTRRAKSIVATVWLLSFIICFPPLLGPSNDWGSTEPAEVEAALRPAGAALGLATVSGEARELATFSAAPLESGGGGRGGATSERLRLRLRLRRSLGAGHQRDAQARSWSSEAQGECMRTGRPHSAVEALAVRPIDWSLRPASQ